jgi:DNA polymerase-3 subunit delta'
MLKTGHISHACLFSGIEGIGKRSVAISFAKALNCQQIKEDSCNQCLSCQKIEKKTHPDLFTIGPEKNVIRIETIREFQRRIIFRPLEGKQKVVIINHAEKLNLHAANCLLKTLEEPPQDTVIILVANTTRGLIPTIVSRCQKIHFTPLKKEEISLLLQKRNIVKNKANLVASLAQGSIKKTCDAFFKSF